MIYHTHHTDMVSLHCKLAADINSVTIKTSHGSAIHDAKLVIHDSSSGLGLLEPGHCELKSGAGERRHVAATSCAADAVEFWRLVSIRWAMAFRRDFRPVQY